MAQPASNPAAADFAVADYRTPLYQTEETVQQPAINPEVAVLESESPGNNEYGPAPSAPSATPVDLVAEAESDHRDHEDEREAAGERKMRDEDNMMEHSDSNPSEPSDSDDDHGEQWMTVPSLEQQPVVTFDVKKHNKFGIMRTKKITIRFEDAEMSINGVDVAFEAISSFFIDELPGKIHEITVKFHDTNWERQRWHISSKSLAEILKTQVFNRVFPNWNGERGGFYGERNIN